MMTPCPCVGVAILLYQHQLIWIQEWQWGCWWRTDHQDIFHEARLNQTVTGRILCYHTPASRFSNLIVFPQTHQWINYDACQSGMTSALRDAIITALLNSPGKPLPISLEISYGLPVRRAHFSDTVMSPIHPLRKPLRPPEQESLSSCRISLPVHENIRASCG